MLINKKNQRLIFPVITVLLDVVAVNLSFILAYFIRFSYPAPKGIPPFTPYLKGLIFATVIFLVVFRYLGLYKPKRGRSLIDEFYSAMIAASVGTLVIMASTFFYRDFEYSRLVVAIGWFISVIMIGTSRVVLGKVEQLVRRWGVGINRTLIAGAGHTGRLIKERIDNHPGLGYSITGFLDDDKEKVGTNIDGINVLDTIANIGKVVQVEKIDVVIIALPSASHEKIMEIISECRNQEVDFKIVSDLFEIITSPVRVDEIDGLPVFGLKEVPLQGWNSLIKRTMDLAVSLLGLVLLSPLIIVIALLVKMTSPGAVFFKQERVGHDGRLFLIYKFRSMYEDAEAGTGPVWATSDDPRRTKLGRILRRISLDEIPQLWCVLKGDMSLVGPRPERPVFVNQFKETIPRYMERHNVKSGITGWAQVNGLRGDSDIEERTKYDLYYIENWSLYFDTKILIRTAFEFLLHKKAY